MILQEGLYYVLYINDKRIGRFNTEKEAEERFELLTRLLTNETPNQLREEQASS